MRPQLGLGLATVLVAGVCSLLACSSSSNNNTSPEADAGGCSGDLNTILGAAACPAEVDANGVATFVAYDQAITLTCAHPCPADQNCGAQTKGDIVYGQCFDFLVVEIDNDSSGHNYSKCFYDPTSHALVGVIYADGTQDQCGNSSFSVQGGQVDPACSISGLSGQGAGGGFQSCVPVVDAGAESSLLGGGH